jgi:cellulose synthase/poly-beta-1,6-N-acetylglucosamine synthase-like glycosyltransferase
MIKICVLIPVFNESLVIEDTISALCVSGFDKKDIYVIDDRSKDDTAQKAKACGVNVYTTKTNGGKAKAQTEGIKKFKLSEKYDWIVFFDGDTKAGTHFYQTVCETIHQHPDVKLFVGQVMSSEDRNIFSSLRAIDYTVGQNFIKKGQDNFNVIFVSPGCASVYCSKILKDVDLDTQVLAEDMDLTIQVHKLGGKVMYVHGAQVYTQDPNNIKDYMKQVNRWYRGFWQVAIKHNMFSLTKKERVEWYMLYLMADTLFLNKIIVALLWCYLAATMWALIPAVIIDFTMFFLCALYTAHKTKRHDVLIKSPITYWVSFYNLYSFFKSFIEVVVLKKKNFGWNKVKRYEFANHKAES